MTGSDETPATTEWRRASKFYRRPLGVSWLIGLVVIPLLLGAIGYGAFDRSRPAATGPTGALPTLTETKPPAALPNPPTVPALSLAPLSITRKGNDIILTGDFPDEAAKRALVNALKSSVGPGVTILDMLGINPNIDALDFSDAGPVFDAAASIPDFNLTVKGDTITLDGTAASADQEDAVETAAEDAWPNLNIVDKMEIKGPVTPTGTQGPTAAPGAPGPGGPGGACANLQSEISRVMGGPITFATNGFLLTPADEQTLTQVADKLKACPGAKVTINGYTDNTGDDAINIPLSANRANTVTDFLIAKGVTRDHLIAKGFGSANPIASNDTADGRAKNRRVEIVVS
ncbi:MAG TPA: OmpA family protein [Mycobacterium sp.]|nr:OmpA family protein [Mycobacterium sp.]